MIITPTAASAARCTVLGQVRLEQHDREAEEGERRARGRSPREAEPAGAARAVLGVGRDQRGHGGQVVGVGRVAQAEQQRHEQDERQRRRPGRARRSGRQARTSPRLLGRQARARHGQLAVGDPAVVRRQQLGHQHAQAVGLEPRARAARAARRFWNTPPGEHHGRRARPLGRASGTRSPSPRQRVVEPGGRSAGTGTPRSTSRATARTVGRASRISGSPALEQRQRIGAALGRVGRRLELDGRLALVVHLGADAAQRRHRVEQPAGARRERRGQPGRAPARPPGASAVCPTWPRSAARQRGPLAQRRREPRARHPPRLPHRGVAAGEPHREQQAHALEARRGRRAAARRPRLCRRRRIRCRRRSRRSPGPRSPCSARQAARCAW